MNYWKRCRHDNNSWIICDGYMMWCYRCGAIKGLAPDPSNDYKSLIATTDWMKPTGPNGVNPYDKWYKMKKKYESK